MLPKNLFESKNKLLTQKHLQTTIKLSVSFKNKERDERVLKEGHFFYSQNPGSVLILGELFSKFFQRIYCRKVLRFFLNFFFEFFFFEIFYNQFPLKWEEATPNPGGVLIRQWKVSVLGGGGDLLYFQDTSVNNGFAAEDVRERQQGMMKKENDRVEDTVEDKSIKNEFLCFWTFAVAA